MTPSLAAESSRIRVIFLTFYFEAWDSLAEVHAIMAADERFEVTVISIPRRFAAEEPFAGEERVSAYFDDISVAHERFDFDDSLIGLERLRALTPDYVFINYPWQRNYQPGYRVERLSEFTRVCYVPYYSLPIVNEPGVLGVAPHLFEQRSHQLASLIFTQDAATFDAYASTSRGNSHVHLTGSPKIDALVAEANSGITRWPMAPSKNLRMVWAPHHSYSQSWLNFGLFPDIHDAMLEFARRHADVEIVLRPHPFLFTTMVDRGLIPRSDFEAWLDAWSALPNTAMDLDGDAAHLFNATDIFVTDGISFLGEYPLATGKPTIFMEKPGHWDFSPLGEYVARANVRVNSFAQFEMVFGEVRLHGLPEYYAEIGDLRSVASPFPGQAAAKIVEIVADDFAAGTPLVNKSLITETPWESRPGTEPAWD